MYSKNVPWELWSSNMKYTAIAVLLLVECKPPSSENPTISFPKVEVVLLSDMVLFYIVCSYFNWALDKIIASVLCDSIIFCVTFLVLQSCSDCWCKRQGIVWVGWLSSSRHIWYSLQWVFSCQVPFTLRHLSKSYLLFLWLNVGFVASGLPR